MIAGALIVGFVVGAVGEALVVLRLLLKNGMNREEIERVLHP